MFKYLLIKEHEMDKKGQQLKSSVLGTVVLIIVGLIILFTVYAEIVPIAQEAGDSLNESNQCASNSCFFNATADVCQVAQGDETICTNPNVIPLSGLFAGGGVVFIIIMAALLILVVLGLLRQRSFK